MTAAAPDLAATPETKPPRDVAAARDVAALVGRLLGQADHGWQQLVAAIALATFASGAPVALMGTSAWLLSRAAEHPPVLYLLAASAGVRFFGIGRGVGRYLERLVGHNLALRMQSALRLITYDKLSGTTLLGRRHGDLLVRVTADVEAIVDLVARVVLPFASAAIVMLGASIILSVFSPLFAVVLLAPSVFAGIVAPWLAQRWSRAADQRAVPARGELADQVRELARCAPDLVAYGQTDAAVSRLSAGDAALRETQSEGACVWCSMVMWRILETGPGQIGQVAHEVGSQIERGHAQQPQQAHHGGQLLGFITLATALAVAGNMPLTDQSQPLGR